MVAVQGERNFIGRVVQDFNYNLKSGNMQSEIESIVLSLNTDLAKLVTDKVEKERNLALIVQTILV